eukprot:TRINITY_DN4941_c0_g1_i1.p1 TRINITY_DN4941_c0_g1~~TRINITY_DN4941_c0_g1_i1.p1  ORF type:complete len:337 (+),score=67.40 TRINITY_DN4941_c0_g1_i1:69-1079(+)
MDEKKVKMTRWFEKKQKIVVRHLPWNLTEEGFIQVVKENVGEEILAEVAWMHYEKGKLSRMKLVPSFASMVFSKIEYVRRFHEQFDGRSFTDSKGYISKVTVEFAPNHQIPSATKHTDDALNNTIHEDEDYLAWKAQRENPTPQTPKEDTLDAWLASKKDERTKPKAETPLTEAVKDYLWGPGSSNRRGGRHRRGLQVKSEKGRGGNQKYSGRGGGGGVISRGGGKDRKRDRDRNRERDDKDREKDKAPLPTKIQVKVKDKVDDTSPKKATGGRAPPDVGPSESSHNNNSNNNNNNNHNNNPSSNPSRKGGNRSERGGGNRGGRGGGGGGKGGRGR